MKKLLYFGADYCSACKALWPIVEKEAPIHVSNVALVDPKTNKPTKVGYKVENGKKVRVAKKSSTVIA